MDPVGSICKPEKVEDMKNVMEERESVGRGGRMKIEKRDKSRIR